MAAGGGPRRPLAPYGGGASGAGWGRPAPGAALGPVWGHVAIRLLAVRPQQEVRRPPALRALLRVALVHEHVEPGQERLLVAVRVLADAPPRQPVLGLQPPRHALHQPRRAEGRPLLLRRLLGAVLAARLEPEALRLA